VPQLLPLLQKLPPPLQEVLKGFRNLQQVLQGPQKPTPTFKKCRNSSRSPPRASETYSKSFKDFRNLPPPSRSAATAAPSNTVTTSSRSATRLPYSPRSAATSQKSIFNL